MSKVCRTSATTASPLTGGDTAELQFGNWTNPNEGIPLVITHNGQPSTQALRVDCPRP
jgi:hypothetical protein